MKPRDMDQIHALTFDFAFAATAPDSLVLADWVKEMLLPVVEEVFDQCRGAGQRRRLDRLEIDLGEISMAQSGGELARRLLDALSRALEGVPAAGVPAQQDEAPMLTFLRSGQIAWTAASEASVAHKRLLRDLIDTPQAHAVLSVAVATPAMLTRLIRQFDTQHLHDVAAVLFKHWPPALRAPALAWAADQLLHLDGVAAEPFWRWFLTQAAEPASCTSLQTRWQALANSGVPVVADAPAGSETPSGFTETELNRIVQGLEQADFSLLAPDWERVLACAPHLLRSRAQLHWQDWLAHFDDAALTDILCAVQADCAWLLETMTGVLPASQRNALLRPALGRWLAAAPDSLAPQAILAWVSDAAPQYRARMDTLFAFDPPMSEAPGSVPAQRSPTATQDDKPLLAAASVLLAAWPGGQGEAAQAWASAEVERHRNSGRDANVFLRWLLSHNAQGTSVAALQQDWYRYQLASGDGDGADSLTPTPGKAHAIAVDATAFSTSERQTIEYALAQAQFSLLAPYWRQILTRAPHCLRDAHPHHWARWAQAFDDAVLIDLLRVLQQDCIHLLDAVAADPGRQPDVRSALQQWLSVPVGTLAPARIRAWLHPATPGTEPGQGRVPAIDASEAPGRSPDAHTTMADILFSAWPQPQRSALLAWAEETAQRLPTQATGRVALWCWLLSAYEQHDSVDGLRDAWQREPGMLQGDAMAQATLTTADAGERLRAALDEQGTVEQLIRQGTRGQLMAVAAVLFFAWPKNQRDGLQTWTAKVLRQLDAAGVDAASFWRWLLPQSAGGLTLDALVAGYCAPVLRDDAGAFSPAQIAAIETGLRSAQFSLLAPHWPRLIAEAPELVCAAHANHWRLWLARFDDAVVLDILTATQAECQPMFDSIGKVITRDRLPALIGPTLAGWLSVAPGRLSSRLVLMDVMKAAPQYADALAPLYAGAPRVTAAAPAAVDSEHFREPLRVLAPIFSRAEIITINKCLHAGQFAALAPHWDRLLVLAPDWLRTQYPRLARTWLEGFDDEVLIDILSVVQADCCATIERLASSLPRAQLHAALRPALPRWFELPLDRLDPEAIMNEVRRTAPGLEAGPAMHAPVPPDADDAGWLEDALQAGDVAPLQARWRALMLSHGAEMRRIWSRLDVEVRIRNIELFGVHLSVARQADMAVLLHPGLAMLVAQLRDAFSNAEAGSDVLRDAVHWLMQADAGRITAQQMLQFLHKHHAWLPVGLTADRTRYRAATLQEIAPAAGVNAPPWDAALLSAPALRQFVADLLPHDERLQQLDSARLHRLLQAWTHLQQDGDGSGVFLQMIESHALRAADAHAFFAAILRQLVQGERIDLDVIGAACTPPAPAATVADPDEGQAPVPPSERRTVRLGVAALSEQVCRILPGRLADALLHGDLSTLDGVWSAVVAHHPALLAQAAQRYLGRAEVRNRLIERAAPEQVNDILACLHPDGAAWIAPLIAHADRLCAVLPAAPAASAFQQRVLRFAFAAVLDSQASLSLSDWLPGVLRDLVPASSPQAELEQRILVQHSWYEALRGEGELAVSAALSDSLFGTGCLALTMQRLTADATPQSQLPLPGNLQEMITMELCERHAAMTDQLLVDGRLAAALPATFSVAEWQALARAQLPRHNEAVQQAFGRALAAQRDATAGGPGAHAVRDGALQAAFAAAFGVFDTATRQSRAAPVRAGVRAPRQWKTGAAQTAAILLMRAQAPDAAVYACIGLLIEEVLHRACAAPDEPCASLDSALQHPVALERLIAALHGPTLARLLSVLRPALAQQLPEALRAIGAVLPLPLSGSALMLDKPIWQAVFETVFIEAPGPGALPLALAARLAARQRPEERDWLQRFTPSASAASGPAPVTPAQAMDLLLVPLVRARPPRATMRAPANAQAEAFAGDANLANAGLVLVVPYIERLFDLLDIAREGAFLSDEARQRGVHLLQYIVTAQESTPEYLLTLNKLLCAVPAGEPLVAGICMSEKEKDTIEQMLGGVIAHWTAIGASSVSGLRETFLQREGCLVCTEDAWQLTVPQRTFDMLLDRLPWGYKMIKLPWMGSVLNVTWR